MNFVKIKISTHENDFIIEVESKGFEDEIVLENQKKDILSEFNTVYDILENKKDKLNVLNTSIKKLSELILEPFAEVISKANKIRVITTYKLVRCAIDLLEIENIALFLRSEVSYMVEDGEAPEKPKLEVESILSICDQTADPENACKTVSDMLDESDYYDVNDASLDIVQEVDYDILLISAHGEIEDDNSGEIDINGESLTSDELEEIDVSLVYFDSCNQGINTDFLEVFEEEGTTSYYLAPIISNDAGDSSTKTMIWFFEDLIENKDPIHSLFKTRKKLYEYYSKARLNEIVKLNKSFPFRIYEFSQEED